MTYKSIKLEMQTLISTSMLSRIMLRILMSSLLKVLSALSEVSATVILSLDCIESIIFCYLYLMKKLL